MNQLYGFGNPNTTHKWRMSYNINVSQKYYLIPSVLVENRAINKSSPLSQTKNCGINRVKSCVNIMRFKRDFFTIFCMQTSLINRVFDKSWENRKTFFSKIRKRFSQIRKRFSSKSENDFLQIRKRFFSKSETLKYAISCESDSYLRYSVHVLATQHYKLKHFLLYRVLI